MELISVDTQRVYALIREKIITLELAPGTPVSEELLSKELGAGPGPVREAIKLLAHDQLIDLSTGGINVAPVDIPDLEQISEIRILAESFSARQAARRAAPDDLIVLEALCREQAAIPPGEYRRLLDLDHKFHQAIAQAARNKYLTQTLDHLFGLSQRLWYLALPRLDFLPAAVGKHLELADAIKSGNADKAEQVMRDHVQGFYDRVKEVLK